MINDECSITNSPTDGQNLALGALIDDLVKASRMMQRNGENSQIETSRTIRERDLSERIFILSARICEALLYFPNTPLQHQIMV